MEPEEKVDDIIVDNQKMVKEGKINAIDEDSYDTNKEPIDASFFFEESTEKPEREKKER